MHRVGSSHVGRTAARIIAVAVLGVVSSACLHAGPSEQDLLAPHASSDVHGFTAIVTHASGAQYRLTLDGPHDFWGAASSKTEAYRLVREGLGPNRDVVHYMFDGNLRIVGERHVCGGRVVDCENYNEWSWQSYGNINSFGLGLPRLAIEDNMVSFASKNRHEIEWRVASSGGQWVDLTVTEVDGKERTFRYVPGRQLPDSEVLSVVDYREGLLVPPIPALVPMLPPIPRAWDGLMFPGEDEDTFSVGMTHRQIADQLANREGLTGGACFPVYLIEPRDTTAPPVPTFESRTTATGFIWILGPNGTFKFDFEVAVADGLQPDATVSFQTRGMVPTVKVDCSRIRSSPWPAISIAQGLEMVNRFEISGALSYFQYSLVSIGGREPSDGWHTWDVAFRPDFIEDNSSQLWLPYQVSIEPYNPPILRFVVAGPTDL